MPNKSTKSSKINKKKSRKDTKRKNSKQKQYGGNDSNICNRDINELLTTNKKIYKYNSSGSDGKTLTQSADLLAKESSSGWGSNPGPPPDPSGCIIL